MGVLKMLSSSSSVRDRCERTHAVPGWVIFDTTGGTRKIVQQYMKSSRDNERKKRKQASRSANGADSRGRGSETRTRARSGHAARRQTTSASENISHLCLDGEAEDGEDAEVDSERAHEGTQSSCLRASRLAALLELVRYFQNALAIRVSIGAA